MVIAHRISQGTNVVVVNNQSANSKKNLLLFDWMLTTTTFIPWDILWTMAMVHDCTIPQTAQTGGATFKAMLHSPMSSYVFIRIMLPVGENSILLQHFVGIN